MRTSFHHQSEAQHPNLPLSTSTPADNPIFVPCVDMQKWKASTEQLGLLAMISPERYVPIMTVFDLSPEVEALSLTNCLPR